MGKPVRIEFCEQCERHAFGSKSSKYRRFIKTGRCKDLKYQCTLCDFKCDEKTEMMAHIPAIHLHEISCPTCGEVFSNLELLERHKTLPHVGPYSCKPCELFFSSGRTLYYHNKARHGLIKCRYCHALFSKKELTRHQREKHSESIPTCGVCGFKATQKTVLIRHQRKVHLKEKNVTCSICQFQCFGQDQLTKHMIRHQAPRLYECRFCKKTFPRHTTRRFHEMIHTGEKNKKCSLCEAAFVQKASLNYHMMKHHPDQV